MDGAETSAGTASERAPEPASRAMRTGIDGAVRAAISRAIVRIHAEHYGKGATQAKTYAFDEPDRRPSCATCSRPSSAR